MEKLWKDEFRQIEFEFEGRYATLIFPPDNVKTTKWMLKTEYFGAFPNLEADLLRQGYHLAAKFTACKPPQLIPTGTHFFSRP